MTEVTSSVSNSSAISQSNPVVSTSTAPVSIAPRVVADDSSTSNATKSRPLNKSTTASPASSNSKFECPYCSQTFTRHHNLKSHLLIHSEEKKFVCETCSSKFRRVHDLKRHLKLHTGERPYLCEKCGRRFARGDALIRHTKGSGTCSAAFVSHKANGSSSSGNNSTSNSTNEHSQHQQLQPTDMAKVSSQDNGSLSSSLGYQKKLPSLNISDKHHDLNNSNDKSNKGLNNIRRLSEIASNTPLTTLTLPPILSSHHNHNHNSNCSSSSSISTNTSNERHTPPSTNAQPSPSSSSPSIASIINPPTESSSSKVNNSGIRPTTPSLSNSSNNNTISTHDHYTTPSSSYPSYATSSPQPPASYIYPKINEMTHEDNHQNDSAKIIATTNNKYNQAHTHASPGNTDPWTIVQMLENRVRALEERLNSTEGRVSFLETQLRAVNNNNI